MFSYHYSSVRKIAYGVEADQEYENADVAVKVGNRLRMEASTER
jgi:hypothetical protein